MIGSITGTITHKDEHVLLIDVRGVGYRVFVPASVAETAYVDNEIALLTHLYVRDDALVLYGFGTQQQLRLFELLIGVSGIGPKMALAILSAYGVGDLLDAAANARAEVFQSISGIGKKNAQRIIVELQSKVGALTELDFAGDVVKEEVLDALESLGYSRTEAMAALRENDAAASQEEQLKEAIKRLGQ